jgi:hypothetical protein
MGKVYHLNKSNIPTSWPAYVQERDTEKLIFRSGILSGWKATYERNRDIEKLNKAIDILKQYKAER